MTNEPPDDRPAELRPPEPGAEVPFAPPPTDDRAAERHGSAGPARRPAGRRVMRAALALAAAFLVGLVVGWQVLGGDDDTTSGDEASTAELACSAYAKLDIADFFNERATPLDDGTLFLIQGAAGLGQAAGADGDEYAELAEQSEIVGTSLARFDREGAIAAGEAVADECADLFPA